MAIKTAIIGYGRTAVIHHTATLKKHPEFEVVGVYDIEPEAMQNAVEQFGCKTYHSYQEFVHSPDFEFAIVLTFSHTHAAIAVDLLNAGKNVLVTKPWAMTLDEADELTTIATRNNRKVIPFLPLHWGCDLAKIREVIASGAIGKVFQIVRSQNTFGKRVDWQTIKSYGGGYLNNWGPHLFGQAIDVLGERVKEIYAVKRQVINPGDTEDMFYAVMTTESGVLLNIEHNIATENLPHWVVRGNKGTIYVTNDEMDIHTVTHPEVIDPKAYRCDTEVQKTHLTLEGRRFGDPYIIYSHLAEVLHGKTPYAVPLADARHLTEVMVATHESADKGIIVRL
jgi:scyllo-inositol 2-dehydrogenase (NADP+)